MLRALIHAIPNTLTIGRLFLGLAYPGLPEDWQLVAAIVGGLSDLVDGVISRWTHSVTRFGQMLDPVADKVFVLSVVGTLIVTGRLGWGELLLLAQRDIIVVLSCLWVLLFEHWGDLQLMRPSIWGKFATGGQFAYILYLLAYGPPPMWLLVAAAVLSGLAAIHYGWLFWEAMTNRDALLERLRARQKSKIES